MSTVKSIYLQHLNGTTPNATMDTNGNFTVGGTVSGASSNMFRNRIINGDMRIDQRNAGGSITNSSTEYTIDRFRVASTQASKFTVQRNAGSVTPPAGFINYLGCTSLSSYSVLSTDWFLIGQPIEGLNVADLDYGKSTAKTVTLSFWVRSSLTGTFGGSLNNADYTRCYPFSYTISSANTWTYITVTIAGDTTGTWLTTNAVGMYVWFNLGSGSSNVGTANTWQAASYYAPTGATSVVGTSGATFYVTGVQLEVGTTATPFEFRSYGHELALCQRYYEVLGRGMIGTSYSQFIGVGASYKVTKRATPTVALLTSSPTFYMFAIGTVTGTSSTINVQGNDTSSIGVYFAGMPSQAVTGYFCTSQTDSLLSIAAEL